MKKIIIAFILAAVLALSGCGATAQENGKTTENTTEDKTLITVEKFIEMTGISKEKYSDTTLQQFIEDYELTEANVGSLNIERLLSEYDVISNTKDVSDIFDESQELRNGDFTKDVEEIAFYESSESSTVSVYYDLKEGKRYSKEQGYIFDNVNLVEAEEFKDGQELLEFLEDQGVFTWESVDETEDMEDGGTVAIAVRYSDGTVFIYSASGEIPTCLQENYAQVKDKLLG